MPNFNILKKNKVKKTFRVAKIMGEFDIIESHSDENFVGDIEIENKNWKIGIIVGASGTGKTTIANELFKENIKQKINYDDNAVIDNMGNHDIEEISKMFYSVGFGSVPSWLKPYHVLSNGEKMRVDLAYSLLNHDFIAFDEFTSVVDRRVAETACIAINKCLKNKNKKFIAISCHYDIIEWLEPDWVFNTDEMKFTEIKKKETEKNFLLHHAQVQNGKNLGVIII